MATRAKLRAAFSSHVRAGTEVEILEIGESFVVARAHGVAGWLPRECVNIEGHPDDLNRPVIIRTYKGKNQADAVQAFQAEAAVLAKRGYYPTSQSWAQGSYGCGAFLIALLLCIVLVGILIFIYMLLVKPDGTLTVTYEHRLQSPTTPAAPALAETAPALPARATKRCPRCAEDVLDEAQVCRFCGYEFTETDAPQMTCSGAHRERALQRRAPPENPRTEGFLLLCYSVTFTRPIIHGCGTHR